MPFAIATVARSSNDVETLWPAPPRRLNSTMLCPHGAVLVVHSPPNDYVDEVHGRHLGSTSVLEAIERKRPALVVCGHIHQCWGAEATIGATPVINVGPEGRLLQI